MNTASGSPSFKVPSPKAAYRSEQQLETLSIQAQAISAFLTDVTNVWIMLVALGVMAYRSGTWVWLRQYLPAHWQLLKSIIEGTVKTPVYLCIEVLQCLPPFLPMLPLYLPPSPEHELAKNLSRVTSSSGSPIGEHLVSGKGSQPSSSRSSPVPSPAGSRSPSQRPRLSPGFRTLPIPIPIPPRPGMASSTSSTTSSASASNRSSWSTSSSASSSYSYSSASSSSSLSASSSRSPIEKTSKTSPLMYTLLHSSRPPLHQTINYWRARQSQAQVQTQAQTDSSPSQSCQTRTRTRTSGVYDVLGLRPSPPSPGGRKPSRMPPPQPKRAESDSSAVDEAWIRGRRRTREFFGEESSREVRKVPSCPRF